MAIASSPQRHVQIDWWLFISGKGGWCGWGAVLALTCGLTSCLRGELLLSRVMSEGWLVGFGDCSFRSFLLGYFGGGDVSLVALGGVWKKPVLCPHRSCLWSPWLATGAPAQVRAGGRKGSSKVTELGVTEGDWPSAPGASPLEALGSHSTHTAVSLGALPLVPEGAGRSWRHHCQLPILQSPRA